MIVIGREHYSSILSFIISAIGFWFRFYNPYINPGRYHDECVFVDKSWNLIDGNVHWGVTSNSFLERLLYPEKGFSVL